MVYMTLKSGTDSRQGQDIFFLKVSKQGLGPVQHRVQWLPASLFPGHKSDGSLKLTAYLLAVPRFKCVELYSTPTLYLYGVMF